MTKRFYQGEIYHVFNKSIANYRIYKDTYNAQRFLDTLNYYNSRNDIKSFSQFLLDNPNYQRTDILENVTSRIKFLVYCIMPDHYHLLVKIYQENFFSKYISDVENSFTRYFNLKFHRKGPLWQSSFKAVRINNNEQLLHVSRYIHLNPTSSNLVEKPEDWEFSSYKQYINNRKLLADFLHEISIKDNIIYQQFVENQKDYQRKLKYIDKFILE